MGNRIHILIYVVFLNVFLFYACNNHNDCLKGTGKIISEDRHPGIFKAITLDDDINLLLIQDSVQEVSIEAGENLLPEINSYMSNQMLYLQNKNTCNYLRSYQKEITAKIHIKTLETLVHVGSAKIGSLTTLNFDKFLIWLDGARGEIHLTLNVKNLTIDHLSGNGVTYLTGETKNCIIKSTSQGLLDLRDLKINNLDMVADSYNDAYVWVTDTLTLEVCNLGIVYLRGNPFIKSYVRTGQGHLTKMD